MQDRSNPSTLRRLLLIAATVLVGAIGWFMLGEPEPVIAEESSDEKVLARVNGTAITEKEILEAAVADLLKLDRQRHEMIEGYVNGKTRELMLQQAADKKSMSTEEYMTAEVTAKLAEVPQADVDSFYEARKSRIRQPKEAVETQIRELMAREAMFERLTAESKVEIMIDPFRIAVEATGPSKGPAAAPITIIEFSDFECPFCGRVNPALKQVEEKYGDKVRIVFRQFPLDFHANAKKAGEASLCAADQDNKYFWQMHDAMFADQKNLGVPGLKTMASAIEGLNNDAFAECLDSGRFADQVQADMEAGAKVGVTGTPAFFINGRFLSGAQPFEGFAKVIDEELGNS